MMMGLMMGIIIMNAVGAQQTGTEVTMRTLNSIDIEVCADNIMSTEQSDLQGVILTQLQTSLLSTAVYFTRFYTMAATVCYMFVFQARNPDEARMSVQTLLGETSSLAVPYKSYTLHCPILAVPWVGEDVGPLGMNWVLTASELLLWGGCGGGLLALCAVSVCCFVQLSVSKEGQRAEALLARDRRALQRFSSHNVTIAAPTKHTTVVIAPTKKNHAGGSSKGKKHNDSHHGDKHEAKKAASHQNKTKHEEEGDVSDDG